VAAALLPPSPLDLGRDEQDRPAEDPRDGGDDHEPPDHAYTGLRVHASSRSTAASS
jgi:hypothetical protein